MSGVFRSFSDVSDSPPARTLADPGHSQLSPPSHRQTPPRVTVGVGGEGVGGCRCFQSSFPPGCSTVTIRLVSSCSDGRWLLGHTDPVGSDRQLSRGSGCPEHLVQSVSGVSTAILAVLSPSRFGFRLM